MRFISFIKDLPEQPDKRVNSFISWARKRSNFPLTSDPGMLSIYLADKLTPDQTAGFQICMMVYSQTPGNMLPKDLKKQEAFLQAINFIIALQENPNLLNEV